MKHPAGVGDGGWAYALQCVLLPMIWGLLMVWVTGGVERLLRRRRRRDMPETMVVSPEYHI